jgi:hypothetical protein
MTDLDRWLAARRPPPPPSLRRALESALARRRPETAPAQAAPDPAGRTVAERLAGAGLAALGHVAARPSTRDTAIDLLAADALITYACEAAVEAEADGDDGAVERLIGMLSPAHFDQLLQPETGP